MELSTSLQSQRFQDQIREVGIHEECWYPVGWANQLKPGDLVPVTVWQQAIALYRDASGQLHAVEDACPHKGVALHKGEVKDERLVCPYHGWEFDASGQCKHIPYWPPEKKLPCAQVRRYPIQERYNLIWIFPGNPTQANPDRIPDIPECREPGWFVVPITARFQAHFSFCNDNTMDVFHGFLHRNLQGWFDPVLIALQEADDCVRAQYQVSYGGLASKLLGLSDRADRVTTRTISIEYRYPHYHTTMEDVSSLHLMRLPVGPTETRSYSLLFVKIPLPVWVLKGIQPLLVPFVRKFLFMRFLMQDVEMVESEQRTYLANPRRRYVEVNPAIIALQRVIVRQYEQFMQKSRQLGDRNSAEVETSASLPRAIKSSEDRTVLTQANSTG